MENCGITAAEGGCKPRQAPDLAAWRLPGADMESAPTDRGNPATNRKPRVAATHVGAHIVRPGNPAADRKPRATATHVGAHIVRPGNPAADRKPRVATTHVGAHNCAPGQPRGFNRKPRVAATHVGDDARIVPGNPAIPQGPREAHDPPLQTPANARSNRGDTSLGAAVGRDALIPPHPAAAQTPAGGMNPAPTDRGNPAANRTPRATATHVGAHIVRPGNLVANRKPRATATHVGAHIVRPGNPAADRKPRVAAAPCRGRCSHRPGNPAIPQGPREGHDPPLQTPASARPNGIAPPTRATVGRDALIPPHPAGGANPCRGPIPYRPGLCRRRGSWAGCLPPTPNPLQKLYAPADGSRRRGGLCFGPRGVTIIQLDKNCIKQEAFPWGCSKGTQSRRSAG